jgi:hypothetical protein
MQAPGVAGERPTKCVTAQQDDVAGVGANAGHVCVLDVVNGVAGARVLSQGPAGESRLLTAAAAAGVDVV